MPDHGVHCSECGVHFGITPGMATDGLACPECGGRRLFRDQPSPTQSDGTLRDMVDSDTQKDQGGNPLGEGTIMGSDGEKPWGKRDNYMHSRVSDWSEHLDPNGLDMHGIADDLMAKQDRACPNCGSPMHFREGTGLTAMHPNGAWQCSNSRCFHMIPGPETKQMDPHHPDPWMDNEPGTLTFPQSWQSKVAYPGEVPLLYEQTEVPPGQTLHEYNRTRQKAKCANCGLPFNQMGDQPSPYCSRCQAQYPELAQNTSISTDPVPQRVEMSRTLNMEPYPSLWEEGNLPPRQSAILAPALEALPAIGEAVGIGGAEAAGAGAAGTAAADAAVPAVTDAAGSAAADVGGAAGKAAEKGLLSKAKSKLMSGALFGAGQGAGRDEGEHLMQDLGLGPHGNGGGSSGGSNNSDPQATQPASIYQLSGVDKNIPMVLLADLDTPHSVKSVDEQEDDPEKQDQKEFNDGDKNPSNQKNPNLEDSGKSGEDAVNQKLDAASSPGLDRMQMLLPLLLHYFHSDESGENDPLIRALHDTLEQEDPGYLNKADDPESHHALTMIIQQRQHPRGVHANAEGPMPDRCARCASGLTADGTCPNCGHKAGPQGVGQGQMVARHANHQGPSTPEQIAAVQKLLIQHHRTEEVPNVPLHPELYGKEMAQISRSPNVAPLPAPGDVTPPPAPPQMPPGAPGGMPVPPMGGGAGPGMPMQPMSSITKEAPGKEHMKGVSPKRNRQYEHIKEQLEEDGKDEERAKEEAARTVNKQRRQKGETKKSDANNAVPRCPRCNSATTTVDRVGDNTGDGSSNDTGKCHSCGNIFKIKKAKIVLADLPNPALLPDAERHDRSRHQEHDPAMVWKDNSDQPLQENNVYELHSPAYPVPDMVQVVYVHPDEVGLKLVGEVSNLGNEGQPDIKVTRQEAQLEHYTFVPHQDNGIDQRNDEPPAGTPGLEQIPPSGQTTDEYQNSYPQTVSNVVAAVTAAEDDIPEPDDEHMCAKCGSVLVDHTMSSPETTMHECVRCAHVWETKDEWEGRHASTDLSWIMESSTDDDFFANMDRARAMRDAGGKSRNIGDIAAKDGRLQAIKESLDAAHQQRVAGKHFTPAEQRELINEQGHARNLGDLDLSHTHYDARTDYSGKANGENVPDEHLIMGL